VTADLPGAKKENVDITMKDGTLLIQVRECKSCEKKEANYLIKERSTTSSTRAISLPYGDANGEIQAELKDGALTVMVPKSEDKKTRKIVVK
jgi:HSP20 family protein